MWGQNIICERTSPSVLHFCFSVPKTQHHAEEAESDLFRLDPPKYVMRPPVAEHGPLHSKSICKNMARASGGANNMRPLSWGEGAQTQKIRRIL